jgi:tetratricopeptide (TPR) repeat protein
MKKGKSESVWPEARIRSDKRRNGSSGEATKQIESLPEERKWRKARFLLQEEMLFAPSDHWVWITLGLTYYEEKEYDKALACSKQAVELEPSCPLGLWHYAGCLYMRGEESSALAIWSLLLARDPEEIANEPCGEGIEWAMQLINDVHYRVARYYQRKEEPEMARTSFEKYLHNRAHGVTSIYDSRRVQAYLAELLCQTS